MHKLNDAATFFEKLGGLHDARVDRLTWVADIRRMSVLVDDIHSNALGMDEYCGPTPAELAFDGVETMDVDFQIADVSLKIYELEAVVVKGKLKVEFAMAPGGRISLVCESVLLQEV